jgi:hypothetical protein
MARKAEADPDAPPPPSLAEQVTGWWEVLATVQPPSATDLSLALQAAAWRAVGAALTGDPAKAPAAAMAALEAAERAEVGEVSAEPVTTAEVEAQVRRAVRRGLASDDPRRVGEALALWRAERAMVDPEGVAGAAGAAGDALAAELLRDAEAAAAAALAMSRAGEAG